ncbi:hypothetical protein [Bacteroides stercorirosoris]|uniref:Uncharacterized protein n=1 Tax=Bacteroides stercorirosoris TaxID=871324 RepID=A0A1M6FID1_9BACE|nr:hypothetical protein [Bacteroides stercorirosoris]SHI97498.1 hypothetical protein SAMN05444350_11251 [Bacteroides stercorirosoris]
MKSQKIGNIENSNLSNVNTNNESSIVGLKKNNSLIKYIPITFSLLALTLSIIALYRTSPITIDLFGASVGALSFLVAILAIMFGYNILGIKGQISKEIHDVSHNMKNEIVNNISDAKGQIYFSSSESNILSGQYQQSFHNLLLSLDELNKGGLSSDEEIAIVENKMLYVIKKLDNEHDISFTDRYTYDRYVEIAKRLNSEIGNSILEFLFNHKMN